VTVQSSSQASPTGGAGHQSASLGDILERVLDRGVVIVGDIRVSLLDIELLTIKLRLLISSVGTARELGIDWWEHDPWLTSRAREPLEVDRGPDRGSHPAAVEAGEPPVIDAEPAPRWDHSADRRRRSADD